MSIYDLLKVDDEERFSMYGVTVGVVTNIDDPEKLGRAKVKLLNRDTSSYETDYIRVATPMMGKQWGMFFFPEVGDEVLVAFSDGDINRPYIIGSLWNKNHKPPVEIKDSKNDIRKIKTKSGHELIFNDEKGKENIVIKTPKELSITLDDEKEVITIKDKNGNNIMKIDSKNGEIDVTAKDKINLSSGNSKLEIDGSGNNVTIESTTSIKLKSQQISIEAKGNLDIKSSGVVNIKAGGPANIKGAIVKIN